MTQQRSGVVAVVAAAAVVAAGIAVAGYLASHGLARFRADVRTVTVKGLVERQLEADAATWTIALRRAAGAVAEAHAGVAADREAVLAFLRKQGLDDAEIEVRPARTLDKLAQEGVEPEKVHLRYLVTAAVVVSTKNVSRVTAALGATDALLERGVLVDAGEIGGANPRYHLSRFNDLRPQLLAEATRNARSMAEQFAQDAGTEVGRIRSAHQGAIQIFGADGADESGPWSATSSPVKNLRLVSTFEFELR